MSEHAEINGYQFDLPIGAIVEILGNRYRHLGGGKFTGTGGTERPTLIEAISDSPTIENDTVLLTQCPNEKKTRYRMIFYAGTEMELAERKAQS